MLLATPLLCLAVNIYHEARGEHTLGQLLVGQVTMNRAAQDPENVCAVTLKPAQFSWTIHCLLKGKVAFILRSRCLPRDVDAWEHAQKVAATVLSGHMRKLTCADHYHTWYVHPQWASAMQPVFAFQGHRFFASTRAKGVCSALSQS